VRAATVVQQLCKSCRTCFVFYCIFHITCDRSLNVKVARKWAAPRPSVMPVIRDAFSRWANTIAWTVRCDWQQVASVAKKVKQRIDYRLYNGTPISKYRTSLAIWDHTVGSSTYRVRRLHLVTGRSPSLVHARTWNNLPDTRLCHS